ncbi:LacI family DNA-binding transcriptional regulator [Enterococcus hulanensis]|uniref:DUF536 domain-containing protein n=1 Tax=Enterococcus hulanensis TaxID=2559929 RepID=UPI0028926724|nr:DUF536 domain-containing protein [Enterococcus hulanensis]MDT2661748.1 LacI family DNA-binding transcriptional regulator [Enterococcus hulanensis]
MSEQLYTMREIATLAGVSRTTVFRYIQKEGIQPHKQETSKKQFSEQQKDEIVEAINPNADEEIDPDRMEIGPSLLELLKSQLEAKDDQIAQLQKALDQQQQLQLKTQTELESTRQQLAMETQMEKKSFWARLFGH